MWPSFTGFASRDQVHVHAMLLAVEPVQHLVAVRHLAAIVYGVHCCSVLCSVSLLHLLLNLVRHSAGRRSGYRGRLRTAANLVPQQAPTTAPTPVPSRRSRSFAGLVRVTCTSRHSCRESCGLCWAVTLSTSAPRER